MEGREPWRFTAELSGERVDAHVNLRKNQHKGHLLWKQKVDLKGEISCSETYRIIDIKWHHAFMKVRAIGYEAIDTSGSQGKLL